MRTLLALLVVPSLVTAQAPAAGKAAPGKGMITEWQVPWADSRPRDPYLDAQGRVWFVGQRSDYLAYLDQKTGEFKRFELEAGAGPHNLIVDASGNVWYAGNRKANIGKLNPSTGKITLYPMPDPAVRDPHTLVFDQKGDIWFTAQGAGYVGKLTTATGKVDVVKLASNSRPYGIVVDAEGNPWFNEFGTNKIGTIDAKTMALRELTLPDDKARSRRLVITSDGAVWYVDYSRGFLGKLDPATGAVREWAAPGAAQSRPYAMAVDSQDRIWFVETGVDPNRLVGFDPKTERFFSTANVPSGGGTVRHMVYHEPTQEIWFGTDANTVGRARVP